MHTDSSSPWHCLVNTNAPFTLVIYRSADKYRCYGVTCYFVIVTLLPLSAQTLMVAAFCAYCLLLIYGFFLATQRKISSRSQVCALLLSGDGYCRFDQGPVLKLAINSRVGFAGCWLVLSDELLPSPKEHKRLQVSANFPEPVTRTRFIFKDSLSPQDFARLTRVLLSLKRQQVSKSVQGHQALK